jgi:uncharacterized repeat protein (TIGR03803 family)
MSPFRFSIGMLAPLALALALSNTSASAQTTFTVLHNFDGVFGSSDGTQPNNSLLRISTGRLFGTTTQGGTEGGGTVYSLSATGVETVIHRFTGGTDGSEPESGLIRDSSGNLYGTTGLGGIYDSGIVYKIAPSGSETILYTFTGGVDGGNPAGGVVRDSNGNLYGTTYGGGTIGVGTIYKIDSTGQETVLHSFDVSSGLNSWATLLLDSSGNLYGTGGGGTDQRGVVFKLDASGNYSTLYSFQNNGKDGEDPNQNLLMDSAGNIFGTTIHGGIHNEGTIFKIKPDGTETVLHSFGPQANGMWPIFGLTQDSTGNLYGVTLNGGAYSGYDGQGDGTVFKFSPKTRTFSILHSFSGSDGMNPCGGLVRDSAGNLYGTAQGGGPYNNGGNVFELSFP